MSHTRLIAVSPMYNAVTGGGNAAQLLAQCIYWHGIARKRKKPDFYKSLKMWSKELGLSESQISSARNKLKAMGLISWYITANPNNPAGTITFYKFYPERYKAYADNNGQIPCSYTPKNDAPTVATLNDLIIPTTLLDSDPAAILQKLNLIKNPPDTKPHTAAQLCLDAYAEYADYEKRRGNPINRPLSLLDSCVNKYNQNTLETQSAQRRNNQRQALAAAKAKASPTKRPPVTAHPQQANIADLRNALRGTRHV